MSRLLLVALAVLWILGALPILANYQKEAKGGAALTLSEAAFIVLVWPPIVAFALVVSDNEITVTLGNHEAPR